MLGSGEILVILFIVLILFGGKKLPEFAQSLGRGIREFKKACYGEEDTPVHKDLHKDIDQKENASRKLDEPENK